MAHQPCAYNPALELDHAHSPTSLSMTTPEISDDPDWTVGNFEITSSDNVRFKIKEYYLYSAR
jgi:hypothetical protein